MSEERCGKCGHAKKHHCIPPVVGNDEWEPATFGVTLHCMPPYPSKGSSCGCDGFVSSTPQCTYCDREAVTSDLDGNEVCKECAVC